MNNIKKGNLIIDASATLIILMSYFSNIKEYEDIPILRSQIITEIKLIEKQLIELYPKRTVLAARYCLCAALDEMLLSTEWGIKSIWSQESLLNYFHQETWGGERFFIIIDEMLKEAEENIDFLEFAYLLLSLGFEGKYYGKELRIVRDEIRNKIFYRIQKTKSAYEKDFVLCIEEQKKSNPTPFYKYNSNCYLIIIGIFTVIIFTFFNMVTMLAAHAVVVKLSRIATNPAVEIFTELTKHNEIADLKF